MKRIENHRKLRQLKFSLKLVKKQINLNLSNIEIIEILKSKVKTVLNELRFYLSGNKLKKMALKMGLIFCSFSMNQVYSQRFESPTLSSLNISYENSYVDLDGDGDIDVVSKEYIHGGYNYENHYYESPILKLRYYKNNMVDGISSFTNAGIIFKKEVPIDFNPHISFTDLDLDGDLDVICTSIGEYDAYNNYSDIRLVSYNLNIGTGTNPSFNITNLQPSFLFRESSVNLDAYSSVYSANIVDFDQDNDQDMFIIKDNQLYYYENTTGFASLRFAVGIENPFGLTSSNFESKDVLFNDFDIDGDIDLTFYNMNDGSEINYCENIGDSLNPAFASSVINPFGLNASESDDGSRFVDFDEDNDLDFFSVAGLNLNYFENITSNGNVGFASPIVNPFCIILYETPTLMFFSDVYANSTKDLFSINPFQDHIYFYENSNQALTTNSVIISNEAVCIGGNAVLEANSNYTIKWYDAALNGNLVNNGNTFITPPLYSTTSYFIKTNSGSCESDNSVQVTVNVINCPKISPQFCNITLTNLNDFLSCTSVTNAVNYRYKVTNGTNTYFYTKGSSVTGFNMSLINGVKYGSTYQVSVAAKVGGVWTEYGETCSITTPLTRLNSIYCSNSIPLMTTNLTTYPVANATNYRYRANIGGFNTISFTKGSSDINFNMSNFPGVQYNTTYNVKVSAYANGIWSEFGPNCVIVTPVTAPLPDTLAKIKEIYCNTTIASMNDFLSIYPIENATDYRYRANINGTNTVQFTKGSNSTTFRMSLFPGIQYNTTYNVKASALINGVWMPFGPVCVITTPASAGMDAIVNERLQNEENEKNGYQQEITIETYPNPNNGVFTLLSSHEGKFKITNELGQIVKEFEVTNETDLEAKIENLDRGIYMISAIIEDEIVIKKVVVE